MAFSLGPNLFKVSVQDVFVANRKKTIKSLREAGVDKGIVFLKGGEETTRFDTDHEPVFRQESYFWYLSGVKEPDCSLAIDIANDSTVLFIPRLPESYATIMGRIKSVDEWKEHYLVDQVCFVDELELTLESMVQGYNGTSPAERLLLLKGRNSDSGKEYEPPNLQSSLLSGCSDKQILFPVLAECRVIKSDAELLLLRHVTEVTSFAHSYVMRHMKPDMMEYQGESLFRHYCYYNYGCRLVGYTPICGCGPNGAILHYGHAGEPNSRQAIDGDMCLFDMGTEYFGYGSDVTCSFPINGKFTAAQRAIYSAVLDAQVAVYSMMKPGVSWVNCHKAAEREIIKHLVELGLIRLCGLEVDDLIDMRLGAVFMPHGLGHFIGIDTHDVGGYLEGHPSRVELPGLRSLRTARILREGMTITVEPGCYFIDHLLDEALRPESPLRKHIDKEALAKYRGFGGVRLEDVVCVTTDGCENFTIAPRTVEEVEAVASGQSWPPLHDSAPSLRRTRLLDTSPLPLHGPATK